MAPTIATMLQELSRALNDIQLNPNITIPGETVSQELERYFRFLASYPIGNTDLTTQWDQFKVTLLPIQQRINALSKNSRKANRPLISKIKGEVDRIQKILDENELLKSDDEDANAASNSNVLTQAEETIDLQTETIETTSVNTQSETETHQENMLKFGMVAQQELSDAIASLHNDKMEVDPSNENKEENLQSTAQDKISGEVLEILNRDEKMMSNDTNNQKAETMAVHVEENKPVTMTLPKISNAEVPNQQVQMSAQQYADILQQHISAQEHELSMNRAALVNLLNAPNPPLLQKKVPENFSHLEIMAHNTVMNALAKVNELPKNPTPESVGILREQLSKIMKLTQEQGVNFLVIQPFVLDRFMFALDEHSLEILIEKMMHVKLNLTIFRDFLASRQEALLANWARKSRSAGAASYNPQNDFRLPNAMPKQKPEETFDNKKQSMQRDRSRSNQRSNYNWVAGGQSTSNQIPSEQEVKQRLPIDTKTRGDPNNGEERLPFCLHPSCKSVRHRLFSCPYYMGLTILDRENFIKGHGICRSCVQAYHHQDICTDKECDHCKVVHNSTLCPVSETKRVFYNKK